MGDEPECCKRASLRLRAKAGPPRMHELAAFMPLGVVCPMGGRARRPREGACEGSAAEGGCWPAHGGGGRTHGQREEAHEEEDGEDALGEHAGWWSEPSLKLAWKELHPALRREYDSVE